MTGVNEVGKVLYPMVHQIHQNEHKRHHVQNEKRLAYLKQKVLQKRTIAPGVSHDGVLVLENPGSLFNEGTLEIEVNLEQESYRFKLLMQAL